MGYKMGYSVRNEAAQVLKLVVILSKAFGNFICSDSNLKPIIYGQFTALEYMRSYSQRTLLKNAKFYAIQ